MRMMSAALAELHAVRRGSGRPLFLVHGSAADHTTWIAQIAMPPEGMAVIAYDRRGSASIPFPDGVVPSTAQHVEDAAAIVRRHTSEPLLVCGSSYGAVIALALARANPELVAGLVLCEPPIPASPWVPSAPPGFGCAFDHLAATEGGEAAAEMFLRVVLGDSAYDAIPRRLRVTLRGMWRQIRADMIALARTRLPDRDELAGFDRPCLLVGGERSPAAYSASLDALERLLPSARRAFIRRAGHAMHFDNHPAFHTAVIAFARDIGYLD
jgi:pimeloyl-ACP methyl ester carboxylesterase